MKNVYLLFAMLCAMIVCSCSNDSIENVADEGYLTLSVSSVGTTYNKGTRAVPEGYDAKTLYVEIVNQNGKVVESTDNASLWEGRVIKLAAGTYTVNAHSAKWDGNDSGRDIPYYAGSTKVTVRVAEKVDATLTCTLANVKVSVNFDKSVLKAFKSAQVEVSSSVSGIASQLFNTLDDAKPAYFPVGNLIAKLTVINERGEKFSKTDEIKDVQARDHYILNYTTKATGDGSFTIGGDDSETQYTYTISVPTTASTSLIINSINAWSTFAWIEGSIPSADNEIVNDNVKYLYKKAADTEWSEVAPVVDGDKYKVDLRGLEKATTYNIKMTYEGDGESFSSSEKTFTTEDTRPLPNGNLDNWCTGKYNNKDCTYPNLLSDYNAGTMFWDTSNPGSSLMNKMVTTQETADVHTPGGSAARLASTYIVIKFAAASMYAGSFGELKGTSGAVINFGQPWSDRPTQLKGWFKYSAGAINRNGGAPAGVTIETNKTPDLWSAYVVLADEGYAFDNTNIAGTAWNYETDPRVVAYGALPDDKCVNASEWTEFTVDIDYHDLNRKPKTIIVVFSSSKYGDYFTGCDSAVLLLDDLQLVYGEPTH